MVGGRTKRSTLESPSFSPSKSRSTIRARFTQFQSVSFKEPFPTRPLQRFWSRPSRCRPLKCRSLRCLSTRCSSPRTMQLAQLRASCWCRPLLRASRQTNALTFYSNRIDPAWCRWRIIRGRSRTRRIVENSNHHKTPLFIYIALLFIYLNKNSYLVAHFDKSKIPKNVFELNLFSAKMGV